MLPNLLHIERLHRDCHFSFYLNCIYFPQTTVLLDEAKIREDARNVQHKCLEKDYAALKEENKTVRHCVDLLGYFVDH